MGECHGPYPPPETANVSRPRLPWLFQWGRCLNGLAREVDSTHGRAITQGKTASKGAVLNGPTFPKSQRSILHVAVMMQHTKVVKDLVDR